MLRTGVTKPRALAFVAGGLPALAFPEPSLWWLAYVSLVPFMLVVRHAPTAREAVIRGWFGGAGFIFFVHHWLLPNLHIFLVVVAVAVGALWAPWGWLVWRVLRGAHPLVAVVLLPAGWLAIEVVRSMEYLGGPWGLMGASQWQIRPALALASLGGVWLVSALVVAVNAAVTVGIAASNVRKAAAVCGSMLVGFMLGWWAVAPTPASAEGVRIGVVQTGVVHGPAARFDRGEALTRSIADRGVDLVVWGESSVGFDLTDRPDLEDRLIALSAEVDAPILVNVDARRGDGSGIHKSSVLVTAAGTSDQRYDKMRLVPFGEYVPLRFLFGWLTGPTEAASEDRRRGEGLAGIDVNGFSVGPLVCFESAFPDMSRNLADRGVDALIFQSSTSTFQQSWAPEQHASLGAIRAAETWRPVVHATLTGVSAVYDPDGALIGSLPTSERTAAVYDVRLAAGVSPYVRFGDWVPALALAVLAGAALREAILRRSRSGGGALATGGGGSAAAGPPPPDREGKVIR